MTIVGQLLNLHYSLQTIINLYQHRAALEQQALGYCAEHYPLGACTVYSNKEQQAIIICVSSAKFNPDNYW